ncbi:MAG: SAM-dependent methyltransferase [Bacteroidota bacterium]
MASHTNPPSVSAGKLYLIPTVLAPETASVVLSPQIKEVIGQTTYFFAENLRTARRCISDLQIGKSIQDLSFYLLDKDTPLAETRANLQIVLQGHDAGVLSEAGCPGVADPGAVAIALAHQLGITVVPLVGPSSILLALMSSGFSGQSFVFHGYLPIDKVERGKAIKSLEREARSKRQTQIFMETPFRNNQLLQDIVQQTQPDTQLCIACQLTASDEFIRTQSIKDWKKQLPDLHKKPTIFLFG